MKPNDRIIHIDALGQASAKSVGNPIANVIAGDVARALAALTGCPEPDAGAGRVAAAAALRAAATQFDMVHVPGGEHLSRWADDLDALSARAEPPASSDQLYPS